MRSVVIWSYRTVVLIGFLLVGLYWLFDVDVQFVARWAQMTTALALFFSVYFGFRLKADRNVLNDLFLSLFWLVLGTCVMFSLLKEPHRIMLFKRF